MPWFALRARALLLSLSAAAAGPRVVKLYFVDAHVESGGKAVCWARAVPTLRPRPIVV